MHYFIIKYIISVINWIGGNLLLLEREVLMITIANPEKYVAGLYERLSNENIEVGNGEVIVSNDCF